MMRWCEAVVALDPVSGCAATQAAVAARPRFFSRKGQDRTPAPCESVVTCERAVPAETIRA